MKQQHALLIFAKNPAHGKVKTRLATSIGNDAAYEVYLQLLRHTKDITENLPVEKFVFYSGYVDQNDLWDNHTYHKQVQSGDDLGERMKNAFTFAFDQGYSKVVIIGTDCPGLKPEIILQAFNKLDEADVVIGPAFDGGYYLLALKQAYPFLFEDLPWSTAAILSDTASRCTDHHLSFLLLEHLHDVDEEKDLVHLEIKQP